MRVNQSSTSQKFFLLKLLLQPNLTTNYAENQLFCFPCNHRPPNQRGATTRTHPGDLENNFFITKNKKPTHWTGRDPRPFHGAGPTRIRRCCARAPVKRGWMTAFSCLIRSSLDGGIRLLYPPLLLRQREIHCAPGAPLRGQKNFLSPASCVSHRARCTKYSHAATALSVSTPRDLKTFEAGVATYLRT